jgi:outer membrane protein
MEAAPGRIAAESLLNKMGEGFRTALGREQDSAQKMLADYQKNSATMTAAAKDKREKDLQAIEADLQAKNQAYQQQFDAKRQEVMAPISDLVKSVLDGLREEGCYAMLFDNAPGASNIVSADKNLDITDKAVSKLRAQPAPKLKATETIAPAKGAPAAPAGVTSKPPIKPPPQ